MMFLGRHVNKITTHVRLKQSTIHSNVRTKNPLFFQSLIKETNIQQPAFRAFNVIQNPYCNSKWSKLLNTHGWPARIKESRGFRQKVSQSSSKKSGPLVGQKEIPTIGKENESVVRWGVLKRPFIFTIGFTAISFSGAAIWQYENMRKVAVQKMAHRRSQAEDIFKTWSLNVPKVGWMRQELNKYWNQLSEGDKVFAPILALNVLVFALWRVPSLQPLMYKYFSATPQINKGLPMLLSAFSHISLLHLGCNMFVLHSFSEHIIHALGKEQFMGLYLSSCVITSFFSHVSKIATGRIGSSLGASGAICTVLGVFGTMLPDAQMQIILLPFFTFSASVGIKSLMALDTVGILARWQFFDHAAHLSGMLFGIWWCHQGHSIIWHSTAREHLMSWWHSIREKPPP